MLKVLHILYTSLPEKSGSSIRSHSLLMNQIKNRISVSVIVAPFVKNITANQTYSFEGVNYKLSKSNFYTKSEKISSISQLFSKAMSIFAFFKNVKSEVKENKPNVIHSHSMFYCAFVGILVSIIYKIPHIYEVRSFWELRTKPQSIIKFMIYRLLENLAILCSDEIVVISQSMKADIQNRGWVFKTKTIEVIYNALDLDTIDKSNKIVCEHNFNSPLKLGYVGNISPIEGLDVLIDLINTRNAENKFELHVYGSGNQLNELKNLVNCKHYKNVFFHGEFERCELENIYLNIDVVVIPRKPLEICEKVTPLKPLEAIIYKKPLVCSNVNGILELFDYRKDFAYFYDKRNEKEMLDVLDKLLFSKKDELVSQNKNAIEYIKLNRSWQTNTEKYLKIYSSL